MKNKLPTASFTIGVTIWLLSIVGLAYLNSIFQSVENHDPRSIFKPGSFESLLLILSGAAATGLGLLIGLLGLKVSGRKKFSWVAIIINGLYCLPIGVLLLLQVAK